MNREQLDQYIQDAYGVKPDFPWAKYQNYAVFRHGGNQKWFALVMEVPKSRLSLSGDGTLQIVNLKCDPLLIGSLLCERGFFPAYHMNKSSWITASLDGSVDDEKIKMLLDMSFEATAPKIRNKNRR